MKKPEEITNKKVRASRTTPDIRGDYNHLLTEKEIDMETVIILKNVRLSHPSLWDAVPYQPGDEPKFKATAIIEKGSENDKLIRATINGLAAEKLGKNATKTLKAIENNPNRFCYQDGDNKGGEENIGMMLLSAKAKEDKPPVIIDRDKTALRKKDGKPYSGCYVNMSVDIFHYPNPSDGFSASLRWVQFVKDGAAFSGGKPVDIDEEIEDLSEGADAEELA